MPNATETRWPTQGIRFGSPDSRDHDFLYAIPDLPDPIQCKQWCSTPAENRNLFVHRHGVVTDTYKGLPDETNNALLATYGLHPQNTELPISERAFRNVPLKVVRATRVILSLLSRSSYREEIKEALRSENLDRRHQTLARIDFSTLEWQADLAKSIAFQLGQALALIDGTELYIKSEIQDAFPQISDLIARRTSSLAILNELRDAYLAKTSGVYVRQKGALNLLMYGNALAIKEWNQYARQCRGMIIDIARERCVFFPMDKFFRFGEGPELTREQLALNSEVEIVEKLDGSMVSLVEHHGQRFFSCKGNFDTEQSSRAQQIASRLPIDRLQTDRFFHVFEVIYPENRFPRGLSIVDYGNREDLVLIAMRDRFTNRLLPYAQVVQEAQRVGLSHPRVFRGNLSDAFTEVDLDGGSLGHEGYVIRTADSGRYFKLKYEGYKEVLRIVNEIRSDRFVREYYALPQDQRDKILALLPEDFRIVAESHLARLERLIAELRQEAHAVVARYQSDPRQFADDVRATVPADLQRAVFQMSRGLPIDNLLERIALERYRSRQELASPTRRSTGDDEGGT